MEYQKIANLIYDGSNQPTKFRTNCAPFTNCINDINNTQVYNAKDIDIVIHMYNLLEYSDNYSITSGSLWQYCKDIPAVDDNNTILNLAENSLINSLNFKAKMTGQTGDAILLFKVQKESRKHKSKGFKN